MPRRAIGSRGLRWQLVAATVGLLGLTSCATLPPQDFGDQLAGMASWYGRSHHGQRTASGEIFDMYALTAAHRTLPFGTRVRVVNLKNGRAVVVRITDRGPYVWGRIIDVSYAAAQALGMLTDGLARVRLEILSGAP